MKKLPGNFSFRIVLVAVIFLSAAVMIMLNQKARSNDNENICRFNRMWKELVETERVLADALEKQTLPQKKQLSKKEKPKMIDLGAGKCIPCRMMSPVLDELKKEYADKFDVEFIDVWKNPDAGKHYRIRLIPTQIFIDENVKEIYRHEGFMSKNDIIKKWKELGYDFSK